MKNTPKYTAGPWSRNIPPARKYAIVFAGRNAHIAQICSAGLEDSEIEANCDLIAAAPDMRDALARAAPWLGRLVADGGHLGCAAPNDAVATLRLIESLLEKTA